VKKINKNYLIRPASLRSDRRSYNKAILAVLAQPGWFTQASKIYSAGSVTNALQTLYNGKCAFCEQKPLGSPAQVEHFRPKNGIFGTHHTGYYWLAYEWSNLLLACGNCNSGKNNHFPLLNNGVRVDYPSVTAQGIDEVANFCLNSPLSLEYPLLLNPEVDSPHKHFTFNPSGKIEHKTARGEESKDRYNLNRDELYVNGRKKKRDDIEYKFLIRLERYEDGNRTAIAVIQDLIDVIDEEIIIPIRENQSFSEYLKQMLLNFDKFFIINNPKSSILLRHAFLRILKSF
jgi:uncharacterized protein (TIGR02646 family)